MTDKRFWSKVRELYVYARSRNDEEVKKGNLLQIWVWWVILDALDAVLDARSILRELPESK